MSDKSLIHEYYIKPTPIRNPLTLVFNKRIYILKQTCSFQPQVCLSMYDLLVDTIGVKGLSSLLGNLVGPLEDNEKIAITERKTNKC